MFCTQCGTENRSDALFCQNCGHALTQPTPTTSSVTPTAVPSGGAILTNPAQPQAVEPIVFYAGFWKRFAAMILDGLVMLISSFLIGALIGVMVGVSHGGSHTASTGALGNVASILLSWLYFALMESSEKQATLGKMAVGIKVVDLQGKRISFGRASGRFFAKIVSFVILYIGFLMAAFTKKKQALHDMMASCLVVNKAGPSSRMSTALVIVCGLLPAIFVIGILAAVAIPAYRDYTIRAKWSGNITSIEPLKAAIAECARSNAGNLANCDNVTKLDLTALPAAPFGSVTLAGTTAAIAIKGAAEIGNCTVTMTPTAGGTGISWAVANLGTDCPKTNPVLAPEETRRSL